MAYLRDILKGVELQADIDADFSVKGVSCDSRAVNKDDLFVAVKGYSLDGYKFINDAVSKGASAIASEEDFAAPQGVVKILVKDSRAALPIIADNFYGHPSGELKVIGVTGTNGKTTVTYIIENILKRAGKSAGIIGTINYRLGDTVLPARNTTPGPLELDRLLAEMVKRSFGYAVMEVSSHSLDQRRVECVLFDVGIFTNITSEHLDYHKTIGNYFKAKARLFERLKKDGSAVLNNDDKKVVSLKKSMKGKVITYGIKKGSDVRAERINISLDGSSFLIITPKGSFEVSAILTGMHNISNILASVAASIALGMETKAIKNGIESIGNVPGRLEAVDAGQPFKVFVDYAHTEDALNNILNLLKKVAPKRIITVFGCGGNRDRSKRPLMGKAACSLSDHVVITSDNPRFEEPQFIIDEIVVGIKGKFSNYDIVVDRRVAIERALALASKGDIVVIAGKGHETYQIIKDRVLPFDDRETVRDILRNTYASRKDSRDNARATPVR